MEHESIMINPVVLIAQGGPQPGIQKLSFVKNDVVVEKIIQSRNAQSVYKVAVSPEAGKIAYADKTGNISVFENSKSYPLLKELLYRTQQLPAVVGLAFVSETVLCVSGSDFKIRIYDLTKPKHEEKTGEIPLPGLAFALSAIAGNRVCALVREGATDHLMVWNVFSQKQVYTGPGFKISGFYLNATVDFDAGTGFAAHGDRNGQLHLYNVNDGYAHQPIETGHGNFYGVAFNGLSVFTAGETDGGKIYSWSLDDLKKTGMLDTINAPVHWLNRLDKDHLTAGLTDGSVVVINTSNKMAITKKVGVHFIRSITSLSSNLVADIDKQEKLKYIKSQLQKIKQLFEEEKREQAYQAIIELENRGFQAEALQALAYAEKAEGELLNELEALLLLLHNKPVNKKLISGIRRIATLYELIYEPELAINTYLQLSELNGNPDEFEDKIKMLNERTLPDSDSLVLLSGFPSKEAVKYEIRKAEILNRYFEEAVSLKEIVSRSIPDELTLERLYNAVNNKISSNNNKAVLENVVMKSGHVVSNDLKVIRIFPEDETLKNVEVWVALKKQPDGQRMVIHQVYYPVRGNKDKFWNSNLLKHFKTAMDSETTNSWYKLMEKKVEGSLIGAIADMDVNDDEDEFI